MKKLRSLQVLTCLAICLLCLGNIHAQECPDLPDTKGSHSFRRIGETIEIPQ